METELLRILELVKDEPYEKIMVSLSSSRRAPFYSLDNIPTLNQDFLRVVVLYSRNHVLEIDGCMEHKMYERYQHDYWSINDSSTFQNYNVEYYDVSKI